MKTAHTPTPYHLDSFGDICATVNGIETIICQMLNHARIGRNDTLPNAEFILKACNSHDALVEALQEVKRCRDALQFRPDLIMSIDAALTAAGAV